MRLPFDLPNLRQRPLRLRSEPTVPLTRKAFYQLTAETRQMAADLACYDQHRVDLDQCRLFNAWLPKVKRYDRLAERLVDLPPARPISRRQVLMVGAAAGLALLLFIPLQVGPVSGRVIVWAYTLSLVCFFFIPERFYGTTVELLEGKLLRIVETMEDLLLHGELGFSEAAFFRVKANLTEAKRELRQQLDLAHRPWPRG
jgi:hypothetical protein